MSNWPRAAALLAQKKNSRFRGKPRWRRICLQRPVKTVLTRKQSTQHHVKRHPMVLKYKVGADAEGHLLAVHVSHRGRYRRLRGHGRQMPAARGVPFLRRLSRSQRGCRIQGRIHQQSDQRRHARIRQQPGAIRDGRRHGSPRGKSGRRRLGHPQAKYSESRRRLRHRPDHARERARNARGARSREGHLQKCKICRAGLRHQEHGNWKRRRRKRLL